MFLESVYRLKYNVSQRLLETRSLAPAFSRKPQVLKYWLFSARHAQFALLAALILLPTIIPVLVDAVLNFIFPPISKERFFGIFNTREENPLRYGASILVYIIIYSSVIVGVLNLLIKHLPVVTRYAEKCSIEKEKEAELLVPLNLSDGITLYNHALEWTIDEERESQLKNKVTTLERANPTSVTNINATVIVSNDDPVTHPTLVDQRYEIIEQLGKGAMGTVYKARDTKLDRLVALKQLSPGLTQDSHLLARFRQEAKALARLSHPHIVQVYDFLESDNHYWIVMELVEGEELEQVLSNTQMKMSDIKELGFQMAEGLAYAHEKGVVHRDFKPANVLLTKDNQIKITDFGIAKVNNSAELTQVNTIMGSPAYMSPEQASGKKTDHRTDIYALGIILYRMIAGKLPFMGDAESIIAQHLTKKAPSLREKKPRISRNISDLIGRMLAKNPSERPQHMNEVSQSLR